MEQEEKEVIAGYTVRISLWIGNKRLIYARSDNPQESHPYMKCICTQNGLLTEYTDALCSDRYEEVMKRFAENIRTEAVRLEAEKSAKGDAVAPCFGKDDVEPAPYDRSIKGRVVALKPDALDDSYRDLSGQLYYVTGGFGAEANSRGHACYCTNLYSGASCRIERPEVLGIVSEEKLPDFAKKTLASCRTPKTKTEREER